MRRLNQQFQIKYDFAESAKELYWKFDLGSTFAVEVAFHMCRIWCINYRNPYPYWVTILSRDWEYLQQTDLN